MIQPVNALSPKVLFRGETADSKDAVKKETRKNLALMNAAGIAIILGAATTAIARSNTSSWRHAGYFGIGAALISMMFVGPGLMYKSGIGVKKQPEADVFVKDIEMSKKLVADAGELTSAAKSTTKATIKAMPKI